MLNGKVFNPQQVRRFHIEIFNAVPCVEKNIHCNFFRLLIIGSQTEDEMEYIFKVYFTQIEKCVSSSLLRKFD